MGGLITKFIKKAPPRLAHLAAEEFLGCEPFSICVERAHLELGTRMASILIFVKIVQGDYREWIEQRDADPTADQPFSRNDFFHTPFCFVTLFGGFVPERF